MRHRRATSFVAGLVWLLTAVAAVKAEDIELFVGHTRTPAARPNILLLLDDSGSMDSVVEAPSGYDPATSYPSVGCLADRVYWSSNGSPPECGTANWFDSVALRCRRALDAFARRFGGTYTDNLAQYDADRQHRWEHIAAESRAAPVECEDDRPDPGSGWAGHGRHDGSQAVYATNGDAAAPWASDPDREIAWGQHPADRVYTLFDGNYLNWYYGPVTLTTRIDVLREVAANLISSVNGVNVGLMGFGFDAGARVHHPVANVSRARRSLVDALEAMAPASFTPLSEALHEAYQYLSGGVVVYGERSADGALLPGSEDRYDSPIDFECQKTHVVLLTDGEPTRDHDSDAAIPQLIDAAGGSFDSIVGASCDVEPYPAGLSPETGHCLDDLAAFMHAGDHSPLAGNQSIDVHAVGFFVDLPVLEQTAGRGGGAYHTAGDAAALRTSLTDIVTDVLEAQATFTSPVVAVDSFNRLRHADDVYVSVFGPSATAHWPGNLKKYRLRAADATLRDSHGRPAVDPVSGFFTPTAQSFWSESVDGADIESGGAAHRIPAERLVYTFLGDRALTAPSNRVAVANALIDGAVLDVRDATGPTRADVIDYINGIDVADIDHDGDRTESRNQIGDPMHGQAAAVAYERGRAETVVYVATNDGYLHAIDAATGVERWAFVPPEFLARQRLLLEDAEPAGRAKFYGIDGSLRLQALGDGDAVVEDRERALLFFGMRRGGDAYYALDVSQPDSPVLLWRRDSADLAGLGQSWSSAAATRIEVGGAPQNDDHAVVILGGGYDPGQDDYAARTDGVGNAIFILDSLSGDLLWRGTKTGGDASFNGATTNGSMDYSIPGDVRAVDLNGDGYADRMFAADMGGQVWRFDIAHGQPAATLVSGGVFASLGSAALASASAADTRRFYYAPDVAIVSNDRGSFMHIGLGSGYRAHPNETANQNRFYALRDYDTFATRTQQDYRNLVPLHDGDLVDVTDDPTAEVPHGAAGWKLLLNDGGWRGEKVLAETRTFNDRVYVTTFRPGAPGAGCQPGLGVGRQYIMSLASGAPVVDPDRSTDTDEPSVEDRHSEWVGAPPAETVFIFGEDPECADGLCRPVQCVGLRCAATDFDPWPRRTFWSETSLE